MKLIFCSLFFVCVLCVIKFLIQHELQSFSPKVAEFDNIEVNSIRVKEQIELSNENYTVIIKNDKKEGILMVMENHKTGSSFRVIVNDSDVNITATGSKENGANLLLMSGKYGPSICLNAIDSNIGSITLTGTNSTSILSSKDITLYDGQLLTQRNKSIDTFAPENRKNKENMLLERKKYEDLLSKPLKKIDLNNLESKSTENK